MRAVRRWAALCCTALLLTGCGGHARETSADGQGKTAQDLEIAVEGTDQASSDRFTFQDVEGNSYEAELLDGVPRCAYDFTYLKTDEATGYKSYHDESKNVVSRLGVDVSEFQGETIDWNQVRDSGIEFVIIRLGYRAYGDSGALVLDAKYDQNVQEALSAGLDVGVYFFSQATSEVEAAEEADFVLEHIMPYEITAPVVFDTEEIKNDTARTDHNTSEDYTTFCKVFCDRIKAAGYDSMIYANMKWMAYTLDMKALSEYDFWYADYHDIPQCPYDYKMWQYTETGVVPGIRANVDLNIWFQEEQNEME